LVEERKKILKTKKTKKVMVVGSGSAGIVAAMTASNRGHAVTMFEKTQKIGGALIPASMPDIKYEYIDLLNYYRKEIKKTKVKIRIGMEVNGSFVQKEKPDVLIVAIGASQKKLNLKNIDDSKVTDSLEAIEHSDSFKNLKIVIIGGGDVGCEIALLLLKKGNFVTIIEEEDDILKDNKIEYLSMVLEKKIIENGCRIFTNMKIMKIWENSITVQKKDKNTFVLKADLVINASGFMSPEKKVKELLGACKESYAVGDCVKPQKIFQATKKAFEVSLKI
jgi:2-enoate reductase